MTTHYEGCYDSGPRHYECALLEVKRLREKTHALVEAVENHSCGWKIGHPQSTKPCKICDLLAAINKDKNT